MKKTLFVALAIASLLGAVAVQAQGLNEARNPQPAQRVATPEGAGIVTYDPGAPADAFSGQQGPSVTVGNRFSSKNGGPLSTGSAYFASFYMANNTLGGGLFVLWGPPTGGGGAPALGSFSVPTVTNNTFNGVSFTPVNVGPDFLAGMYLNSGQPSRGQIGLRSASTNGQGFHGMQISFGGGSGAGYGSLGGQNAMLRAVGTFIIPVELMEFDVQ